MVESMTIKRMDNVGIVVDDLDAEKPDAGAARLGDYVVYTVKPAIGLDPAMR